ncbi:MAG: hypothetical protein H7256_04385 [Bdellovibrio sp.]|nr:hypothetical protein [Bdellovibrio sp.]
MMIACPRCGFSQPEDQYCAQCGVNMHTFRPREKSTFKKLTENVGIQIAVLVVIAAVSGSYLIGNSPAAKFGKSERTGSTRLVKTSTTSSTVASPSGDSKDNLPGLENKEIEIATNESASFEATQPSNSSLPKAPPHQPEVASMAKAADGKDGGTADAATAGVLFKLTYAEVNRDVLQRWISDSSNLGLFQNLQEYSAGILPDFAKRGDKILQYLKTTEKKLSIGQIETNVSGKMSDDGLQVVGLSVNYELKSFDGIVHGAITVARNGRQSRDRFPAEFDLPKGSVFFLVDSLTPQSLGPERNELNMAPFQIFKSQDFMTQNSKFVILIEPVVK